jgi:DNA-binding response OmpR family regulator
MPVDPQNDRVARGALAFERGRSPRTRLTKALLETIAHELRTPLALLLSPLEEALAEDEEPLGPRPRERIALAHRSGRRLLSAVDALLGLAKIELGLEAPRFERTDLGALTSAVVEAFRAPIEEAGLSLELRVSGAFEGLRVDRAMWATTVLHLLSNALDATFHGGIAVTLAREGAEAVLVVRDSGEGFQPRAAERLFTPLFRMEGGRRRSHGGLGLGLALVRGLVELHGGRVDAAGELGAGATFTVGLPVIFEDARAPRAEGAPIAATAERCAAPFVAEASRWLRRSVHAASKGRVEGRVLLADDHAEMRAYVAQLLASSYEVEAVADGAAALEAARTSPPDLVLTDVAMPGVDGFALLAALRADPATSAVPVIFLSARAGEEARLEGLAAGADDYLAKPFAARELLARVSAHVATARARRCALEGARAAVAAAEAARVAAEVRAAELEAQLREAERMATIGTRAGGAAHEVNNMMTAVIGFGELALTHAEPHDATRDDVEEMLRAARRAAGITQELLAIEQQEGLRAWRAKAAESETILVVEDEDLVRRLVRRVLEKAGFRVLEASNGREALALVEQDHGGVQLAVSDLVMPELGGRELAERLRDRGYDFPVLYMTGYTGEHIARHALLDAGAPFLQKPFASEVLVREVRALLARRARVRQT